MTCKSLPATQPIWLVITNNYCGKGTGTSSEHPSGGTGERSGRGCGCPGSSLHLWPRTLLPGKCFQLPGMLGVVGAAFAA